MDRSKDRLNKPLEPTRKLAAQLSVGHEDDNFVLVFSAITWNYQRRIVMKGRGIQVFRGSKIMNLSVAKMLVLAVKRWSRSLGQGETDLK